MLSKNDIDWDNLPASKRKEIERQKTWEDLRRPDYNRSLKDRAERRMAIVEAFPQEVRAVVYDYGLELVQAFWDHRIYDAENMRFLIDYSRTESVGYKKLEREYWNRGVRKSTSIPYLIATARSDALPDGSPRFALNKAPNKRPNILNYDDDDGISYFLKDQT